MIGDNNLRQSDAQTASLASRKTKLPLTETEETIVGAGVGPTSLGPGLEVGTWIREGIPRTGNHGSLCLNCLYKQCVCFFYHRDLANSFIVNDNLS